MERQMAKIKEEAISNLNKMLENQKSSGTRMENSHLNEGSALCRMYNNGRENNASSLNNGFTSRKNKTEAINTPVYKSSFKIKSFIEENTFTNMLIPAIMETIRNNFIKIGLGISAVISALGYLIEKIKN